MQLSHTRPVASALFDGPNLVSCAGLVPVAALAQRCGLAALADRQLSVPTDKGAHAGAKVSALVAGMVVGADSIADMALLRHGAMGTVFARPYAPSTLGSFLRAFTFGHVRQLDAVATRLLAGLHDATPLLAGIDGPVIPPMPPGWSWRPWRSTSRSDRYRPGQSPYRHHPADPDQPAGPHRLLSPTAHPAPTPGLALVNDLESAVHQRFWSNATAAGLTPSLPAVPTRKTNRNKPIPRSDDQPRPPTDLRPTTEFNPAPLPNRCIQAKTRLRPISRPGPCSTASATPSKPT